MKPTEATGPLRRSFLKLPLALGAGGILAAAAPAIDEYDPSNTKIATMVNARATDDQFLFLQQIGVRWVHVQFPLDTNFDLIQDTQKRLARFNIGIHCGIVDHYRSLKIQLGQPGRDADIEKFQTFIRDLGTPRNLQYEDRFSPGQHLHHDTDYDAPGIQGPRVQRRRIP